MNDKSLKIVLYVNSFLPTIGGKQFVVYCLARALKELGHDVRVVSPGGFRKLRRLKYPFKVHRFGGFSIGKYTNGYKRNWWVIKVYETIRLWVLRININRFGCDILHAHTTYPDGYTAVRLAENTNIPVVITPHGEDIQVIPELEFGMMLIPKLKTRISYSLNGAHVLTAISKSVYTALLDANASKDKIKMIPNGVDTDRFSKNREINIDVKEWLGVPRNTKLIVTIGQFHPRKGHDLLIRAMHLIVKHEPLARLIIIGESDSSLEKLIDELELNEFVILAGQIKPPLFTYDDSQFNSRSEQIDHVVAILQNSECYVSAGIGEDSEGLSLAVLEAMATSVPVVASNISGNRDVVVDGENGLLVTPGNYELMAAAILNIITDVEMRKKMSSSARKSADRFTWLEIAKQYESVYLRACEMCDGVSTSK